MGDALALIDAGDARGDLALYARALTVLGLAPSGDPRATLEAILGVPTRHLAAYGTLRPGQSNHHQVASLRGAWRSGTVLGTVVTLASGYPCLTLAHPLSRVPVQVLESDDLPRAWPRLDRFEGPDYQRRLVQVALDDGRSEPERESIVSGSSGFWRPPSRPRAFGSQVAYAYVAGSEQLPRP